VNPDPVRAGEIAVYDVTVTNRGAGALSGVTARLVLPSFVGGVRAISHGGTVSTGTARWNLGQLAALESRTLHLTLAVGAAPAGTTLTSVVSADAIGGEDDSTVVETRVVASHQLQLELVETADPIPPGAGLTYGLTFANSGVTGIAGVTLTAPIPPGTTVVSIGNGGAVIGDEIVWTLGALGAGTHGQRTFSVTVDDLGDADPGTRLATARLTAAATEARAAALTTVDPAPLLRVDAIATPDPVATQGILTYQVTVTNFDAFERNGVALGLPMPDIDPDCFATSQPGSCSDTEGVFATWPIGTLAAGASRTVTLSVMADRSGGTTFPNGTVFATHAFVTDAAGANARAGVATVLDADPLRLAMVESSDPVIPGAPLTYTLTYGNAGTVGLTGTALSAPVPPGTTVVDVSDGGTVEAGSVTWTLGALAAGAHGQRSFTVTVDDLGAADPGTRHAVAALVTTAAAARASALTTVEAAPLLRLDVTATPDPVATRGILTYELTVTNLDAFARTDVGVVLPMPDLDPDCYAATAPASCADTQGFFVTWPIGTLAAGTSQTVMLTMEADRSGGTPIPDGTVFATHAYATDAGGASARASAAAVLDTNPLELALVESADPAVPGEPLVYTLTFGNADVVASGAAVLSAIMPPGTSVLDISDGGQLDGDRITWALGTLAAGAHGRRSFTVEVEDLGDLEPGTRAAAATLASPSATARTSALTTVDPAPLLRLDALSTPDPVRPRGIVTYQLTVTNHDAFARTGVTVVLPMPDIDPDCYALTTPTDGCWDTQGFFVRWPLGTIAAGASRTVTLTMEADRSGGTTFLDGTVFATQAFVTDAGGANARAGVATVLDTSPLQLALVESADPAMPGAPLTYTLSFGNAGPTPSSATVLSAHVPAGTSLTSISDGGTADGERITWTLGTLAAGAHGQRTFTVTVENLGASDPGTRHAVASLATTADIARASALTAVHPSPLLRLEVVATPEPVSSGELLTYELTVTNLDVSDRTNLTVVLPMPDIDPDCIAAPQGTCFDTQGLFANWPIAVLGPGASTSFALTMEVDRSGGTPFPAGTVFGTHAFVVDAGAADARASVAVRLDP